MSLIAAAVEPVTRSIASFGRTQIRTPTTDTVTATTMNSTQAMRNDIPTPRWKRFYG